MTAELFDTHAHLSDEAFEQDLLPVLIQAKAAGVGYVLMPAVDLPDCEKVLRLLDESRHYPASATRIYGALGVHPHAARDYAPATRERLAAWLRHPAVLALGEIGLDYHYDFSPRETQKAVFRDQIALAFDCKKPMILHNREASGDFVALLQQARRDGLLAPCPGVVHCYSGSVETARQLLELGFYFGFDGPITFKNARQPLEVLAALPQDRVLIETDSPYLTPVPFRGKRNDPSCLPLIAAKLAEIWHCSIAEVTTCTTENARQLFGLGDVCAETASTCL